MGELRYRILGFFGGIVLALLNLTLRWERRGLLRHGRFFKKNNPCILAIWHSRQLVGVWSARFMHSPDCPPLHTLISRHGDGRIIANAVRLLGIHSVAGSSSRGARESARQLIELLKNGTSICITPDGPRGPAEKCKIGIIRIAQITGVPIYPLSAASSKFWRVKSWDRMFIPVPFSRAVCTLGEPLQVPPDLTDEQVRGYAEELERRLAAVDADADSNVTYRYLSGKELCTR